MDQSYHAENSSIYAHDVSINKQGKRIEEDYLSAEEGKATLISPSNKINKLIKESLKKKKENETLKIIEQILEEENKLMKKEELEKLNKEVRKTNRRMNEIKCKKQKEKRSNPTIFKIPHQKIKHSKHSQTKSIEKSKDRKQRK